MFDLLRDPLKAAELRKFAEAALEEALANPKPPEPWVQTVVSALMPALTQKPMPPYKGRVGERQQNLVNAQADAPLQEGSA